MAQQVPVELPAAGWQENMEKFRFEPVDAQIDQLCLGRKITSHTEAEPSLALPFPAPSQPSKDRAEESFLKRNIKTSFCLVGGK